ncbi:MAG: UDP-N-acetylmuramate--L-alanine ligase [Chloroherpetonaceae bacterium]|nr:UDP-N-acetylmuramate--L-alanine ligase [Chloroherpetonaceae bacterium]
MKTRHIKYRLLGRTTHVHLVGIGGAGMSAIAEVLLRLGFEVSGSDQQQSEITERLKALGAKVSIGHSKEFIAGADVVAHSSAVNPEANPETVEARLRGIPVIKRDELLGELMRHKIGICVAGTHGKTTTTTMIGVVLQECGLSPTVIIGGISDYFRNLTQMQGSAIVGDSDFMVVEADEYDRTFLKLTPTIAVITNIEAEHLDTYKDLNDVRAAFVEFANKVPFYGAVVCCGDEFTIMEIAHLFQQKVITYGLSDTCDYVAHSVEQRQTETYFKVRYRGKELGTLELHTVGTHNVKNALAALAVAEEIGLAFEEVRAALQQFYPVRRRFQLKCKPTSGIIVVDDYAHHPTEVRATLDAARQGWPNQRLLAVFQPHLYSRTRDFAPDFAASLSLADTVFITEVYPSREKKEDFPTVSGKIIADELAKLNHRRVHFVPDRTLLLAAVLETTQEGDMVITMGAGDITKFADKVVDELKKQGRSL